VGWGLRPSGYDLFMLPLEMLVFRRLRRSLITPISGSVLEIGAGTGANLPYYRASARVTLLDINTRSLRQACKRVSGRTANIVQGDASALPFAASQFDHVVSTLTFCSIQNPLRALAEIARVLVSGGSLTVMEHVKGEKGWVRSATTLFAPLWFSMTRSCHLDREVAPLISTSGLRIIAKRNYMGGLVQTIAACKDA